MIHLIYPSRSRPQKCYNNLTNWLADTYKEGIKWIVSVDEDDPELLTYKSAFPILKDGRGLLINNNKSSVDAINHAAKFTTEDIIIVVSDDMDRPQMWDAKLIQEVKGKTDWILKTKDGIQDWIITLPILDRAYYNRFGYIYHPDYLHLFADTELTCVADILGRKITSNLLFPHNHYSIGKATLDSVYSKNDRTNEQGEKLFLERYARNFDLPPGNKIQDRGMIEWLKKRNRV